MFRLKSFKTADLILPQGSHSIVFTYSHERASGIVLVLRGLDPSESFYTSSSENIPQHFVKSWLRCLCKGLFVLVEEAMSDLTEHDAKSVIRLGLVLLT